MPGKASLEDLLQWFLEGRDDAEDLINLRWSLLDKTVEDGKLTSFVVTHPRVPLTLRVLDLEHEDAEIPVVRLAIETGISIKGLDHCEKHIIYKSMGYFSKLPLAKLYTIGDDEELVVAVDLDKRGLSKKEVSEALAAAMLAYMTLLDRLPEEVAAGALARIGMVLHALVRNWYQAGVAMERARSQLLKAGVPEEIADAIIDRVYQGLMT